MGVVGGSARERAREKVGVGEKEVRLSLGGKQKGRDGEGERKERWG